MSHPDELPKNPLGTFQTTRWSVVVAASGGDAAARHEALSVLLKACWYPLFVFARKTGHSAEAAEDLVQEFFSRLIEKSVVASADPERGRFRAFLLGAFRHFLSNQRDREHAQKRGGGRRMLSLDLTDAEARYRREPGHTLTAERLFDRRWALELLEAVLAQVREHYVGSGKIELFEAMKPLLTGYDDGQDSYAKIGGQLGMSPTAVKTAAHRLRRRYKDALRQHIAQTVADESEIDEEIGYLLGALKSD